MNSIDTTNQMVFKRFFAQKELHIMTELSQEDLRELSQQITPRSLKASFAHRFRAILKTDTYAHLMIDETKRVYQRFLKGWIKEVATTLIETRKDPKSPTAGLSHLSTIQQDPLLLQAQLDSTLDGARSMELSSKKTAFSTLKPATHLMAYQEDEHKTKVGAFKSLSGAQMAGELASYLIGLYCGIDVFHTVVPGYVWLNEASHAQKTTGIYSRFHDGAHTAFELSCSKSEGFEALKKIPKNCVQAICLMHMLRGSEDAHLGNTLVNLSKKPDSGETVITRIYEIDGEHIMSSSGKNSERAALGKEIASMRIWWLGLPQAAEPLEEELLRLIIGWSRDKLYELHTQMQLYSREKIDAQMWRLGQMKTMATEALLHHKTITARDLFFELVHKHPTLGLLSEASDDDVWIYNQVGKLSSDEVPLSSSRKESPRHDPGPMLFSADEMLTLKTA